jgi:hypothetical protein
MCGSEDFAKKRELSSLALLGLMIAVGSFSGCNPRGLPGLKQEAKRQEERTTHETEEAIQKSPAFQELNKLCTQEIPQPVGVILTRKYKSLRDERFLGYGYRSPLNYGAITEFYIGNLTERGWQLTKEKDGGWGPSTIELRKGGFEVKISEASSGDTTTYYVHCERL